MIDIERCETLFQAFGLARERWGDSDFLAEPPRVQEARGEEPEAWSYANAYAAVDDLAFAYGGAGYGPGHRVALLLENRAEHILHLLAASALGFSVVPVNPDYTHDEMLYQMQHSEADLAVVLPHRRAEMEAVAAARQEKPLPVVDVFDSAFEDLPHPARRSEPKADRHGELALLYTSGTTGRPKGCVLSDHSFLLTGHAYVETMRLGVELRDARERFFNPLPLYHMNAGLVMPTACLLTGNCQVLTDRFHARSWWLDAIDSGATVMHHLGIMPPALMAQPPSPLERQHKIRWSLGGGIDPSLHGPFEERFGIKLVEGWAMTETGQMLTAIEEPRHIDTRAFGRSNRFMEGKVVDENDVEVPRGTPGAFLVRTPPATSDDPRDGFFTEYLKNPEATAEAWRGGWFHTGDTVIQREDGMFIFVDRAKNIIRRSGENIAAAEVEACLIADDRVARIAVLAVPDEMRDEEVMACIVPVDGVAGDDALANSLMDLAQEKLAYYKPPGWWLFVDTLPTTGTQKVQKQAIFAKGTDPRQLPGVIDLRARKKRQSRS